MDSLIFFYSYLKRQKLNVKTNNTRSICQVLFSRVPQGSISGLTLFNKFINNFFLCLNKAQLPNFADDNTISVDAININAQLPNFADDNTISVDAININKLIKTLEEEIKIGIDWFNANEMIVNLDKFESISHNLLDSYLLDI